MVNIHGVIRINIMVSLITKKWKGKVNLNGSTEGLTRGISMTTKKTGMENLHGRMGKGIEACGKTVKDMGRERYTVCLLKSGTRDTGVMGRG